MSCTRLLVVGFLIAASAGCATTPQSPQPITAENKLLHSVDPAFGLIEQTDWAEKDWKKYQSETGHKAFSVSVLGDGSLYAVGFSADMKSRFLAIMASQHLCKYFSGGEGICRVVDIESNPINTKLTPSQIGQAPSRLLSHQGIESYYEYKEEPSPKAIAIANPSGAVYWVAGDPLSMTKAMNGCQASLAQYDVNCEVLENED